MSTAYGASYAPLPTAAETASARARISSQRDDIQRAEQEIIGLEAHIAVLRDQIAARRNDIERLRDAIALDENTIAPVRRIPSEIVAAIVVLVATDQDADGIRVLRTLSSVNRVWRDVTLDTPQAWSKVVFSSSGLHKTLPTLRTLDEWLSRSKSYPKDVSLLCYNIDPKESATLLQTILLRTSQIRRFSITFPYSGRPTNSSSRLRQMLSGSMPLLRHLGLISRDEPVADDILKLVASRAPRLESIALLNCQPLTITSTLCDRMRSLTLSYITINDLLDVLTSLPILESLRINHLLFNSTFPDPDTAPVHSGLTLLYAGLKGGSPLSLFQMLLMPRLGTLALQFDSGLSHLAQATLKPLISLHPPLRRLYLQCVPVDEELLESLGGMILLENIVLLPDDVRNASGLAIFYAPLPGSGWVWPRLTRLFISCGTDSHMPEYEKLSGELENIARARYNADGVSKLVTVYNGVETISFVDGACVREPAREQDRCHNKPLLVSTLNGNEPVLWWQYGSREAQGWFPVHDPATSPTQTS